MPKLEKEIKIEVNYAETIQTIIDNANSSKDVDTLMAAIIHYERQVGKPKHIKDDMTDNFGVRILLGDERMSYIFTFINTLVQELKQLK